MLLDKQGKLFDISNQELICIKEEIKDSFLKIFDHAFDIEKYIILSTNGDLYKYNENNCINFNTDNIIAIKYPHYITSTEPNFDFIRNMFFILDENNTLWFDKKLLQFFNFGKAVYNGEFAGVNFDINFKLGNFEIEIHMHDNAYFIKIWYLDQNNTLNTIKTNGTNSNLVHTKFNCNVSINNFKIIGNNVIIQTDHALHIINRIDFQDVESPKITLNKSNEIFYNESGINKIYYSRDNDLLLIVVDFEGNVFICLAPFLYSESQLNWYKILTHKNFLEVEVSKCLKVKDLTYGYLVSILDDKGVIHSKFLKQEPDKVKMFCEKFISDSKKIKVGVGSSFTDISQYRPKIKSSNFN